MSREYEERTDRQADRHSLTAPARRIDRPSLAYTYSRGTQLDIDIANHILPDLNIEHISSSCGYAAAAAWPM